MVVRRVKQLVDPVLELLHVAVQIDVNRSNLLIVSTAAPKVSPWLANDICKLLKSRNFPEQIKFNCDIQVVPTLVLLNFDLL
jgi:hypothetical protein